MIISFNAIFRGYCVAIYGIVKQNARVVASRTARENVAKLGRLLHLHAEPKPSVANVDGLFDRDRCCVADTFRRY